MKLKNIFFGISVCCGLFFFFRYYSSYTYQQQEDFQFFIPDFSFWGETLLTPGGFCQILGKFITQYYQNLFFALSINSLLITSIGILCVALFQKSAVKGYHLLVGIIPIIVLVQMHIRLNYTISGSIALFFMMLALWGFAQLQSKRTRILYGIGSTLLIYFATGPLVALYAILLMCYCLVHRFDGWLYATIPLVFAIVLTFAGAYTMQYIPLTDGFKPDSFHEEQVHPYSTIYKGWILFTGTMALLLFCVHFIRMIPCHKRWQRIGMTCAIAVAVGVFAKQQMPDRKQLATTLFMNQLANLSQKQEWNRIIRIHEKAGIFNYVQLNYLNLALTQKGLLGERLFHYSQKGSQGLISGWDRTFHMSTLLSDIYFSIGDLSKSEGFAMDALRIGHPRMLQRLVQIYLIREEYPLAQKYIDLLSQMPNYNAWAEQHRAYLHHPELLEQNQEMAGKKEHYPIDNLTSLVKTEEVWNMHLDEPYTNKTALEYLGCMYLLDKDLVKFEALLRKIKEAPQWQPLPTHFQEAAAMIWENNPGELAALNIQPAIIQQFNEFQSAYKQIKNSPNKNSFTAKFNHTFWFYYCLK